jgi:hypothetical protein
MFLESQINQPCIIKPAIQREGEKAMDDRKDYVAPAIAWEDVLEQTSLACTGSEPDQDTNYFGGGGCRTDVSKNGAYIDPKFECTWITQIEPVVLS